MTDGPLSIVFGFSKWNPNLMEERFPRAQKFRAFEMRSKGFTKSWSHPSLLASRYKISLLLLYLFEALLFLFVCDLLFSCFFLGFFLCLKFGFFAAKSSPLFLLSGKGLILGNVSSLAPM